MVMEKLFNIGEYAAAGLFEKPHGSLFLRKAMGLRRFYENCQVPEYKGNLLYPSGRVVCPDYMNGLAVNWQKLKTEANEAEALIRSEFCRYYSSVPAVHTVAGNMYTHSIPNYERVLKEGFLSYIPRIEKIKDSDIREGLLHLINGIECYIKRCVEYLESVEADGKLISALKQVPMYPARDIYEAVVSWNFILYLDGCDNLGCVASGLYPYYNGEDITELLCNLFDNLDANNGYSMALGTDYNPLTLQCLEAVKGKRRPMVELFVDENTSDEIWKKALESIRTANGQPAFYNPHVLLGGLKNKFPNINDEDIKRFCGGGCTESMLAGLSNVGSLDAGINLLYVLNGCIKNKLAFAESFEAFYEVFIKEVEQVVCNVTEEISNSQLMRAKYNPLPMRTLLIDDCISNGLDYNNGGARYKWSIVNFAGTINVIDAMLVIRDFVFKNKIYSPEEFINKLNDNDKEFLNVLKNYEISFGKDISEVNEFSNKVSSDIYSMLDDKKPAIGEAFLPASIQFMSQVDAGKRIGATPDGRKAGAPLCDSLAAIFAKDTQGPTALINSVTSLNLERALGVPTLNFNINPDFKDDILKSLILGYMKQGGIKMQITCISRETLEEAYKNPEDHKNLVVRVGGYSEYFYRLSDELKRMVIERTIQNEV